MGTSKLIACEACLEEKSGVSLSESGEWLCAACATGHGRDSSGSPVDVEAIKDEILSMISLKDVSGLKEASAKAERVKAMSDELEGILGGHQLELDKMDEVWGRAHDAQEKLIKALKEVQSTIDQVKKGTPTRVEVSKNGKVKRVEGHQHYQLPQLAELVANRMDSYLFGPPGAGKNTACEQVAKAMDLPYYSLQLSPLSLRSELTGFVSPIDKTPVETPFSVAYTNGGLFLADELDNWNPAIVTAINSSLANGRYSFPWGEVERHPDFVFVGAGNTAGTGGTAQHSARRALDGASRDRLVHLYWDIDRRLEESLASDPAYVRFIQRVRALSVENGARIIISPRATIQGCHLLEMGWTKRQVVESVVFRGEGTPGWAREVVDKFLGGE